MILEIEANELFANLLREYAPSIGFQYKANNSNKYTPPLLIKRTDFGIERIGDLYPEFFNKKLMMTCAFTKRVHTVEDIWNKYYQTLNPVGKSFDASQLATITSNSKRISNYTYDPGNAIKWMRTNDRLEVEATEAGLKKLFDQFVANTEKYVLPTLFKYDSLSAIDRTMNETPATYFEYLHLFTGNGLIFKKMIVAKLNGNRHFQEVCNCMRTKILDMNEDPGNEKKRYLDVWEKLKEELETRI